MADNDIPTEFPSMRRHPLSRMSGRDPVQRSRTVTPLELLFDLAFVTAFGVAASELAIRVADGEVVVATITFVAVMLAVSWDWISFTWFASSYDTDDWLYRTTVLVQLTGVVVFVTGIPEVFRFVAEGGQLDNSAAVTGYIVMRSATVLQRVRAGVQDVRRRRSNILSASPVAAALVGWCILTIVSPDGTTLVIVALALFAVEITGPLIAETRGGTPWHPHHLAERYGLLTIIALGEIVAGTAAIVAGLRHASGWSLESAVVALAGVAMAFGMWWAYFLLPTGDALARARHRGMLWGWLHVLVFISIAGTGAGLHVAALVAEGEAHVPAGVAVTAVAVPTAAFCVALLAITATLGLGLTWRRVAVFGAAALVALAGPAAAAAGLPLTGCLVVSAIAPWVLVLAFEVPARASRTTDPVGERRAPSPSPS
jgi:low temperature requirement protein LtrA